eukprot:TRINITY_DN368_c0_g1_i4.p1 TRINITY_DN368_c0_g1~~TRINITY_DN368_c0_g1_i4.p1  ORF type:complete len:291 (-),score=73.45 TRINITY_DN368_c0_g1_i4:154-1026(-)
MEKRGVPLNTLAVAAAGACALSSGLGFAVSRGAAVNDAVVRTGLRGSVEQAPQQSSGMSSAVIATASMGVLAAAAGSAARRQRTARKAKGTVLDHQKSGIPLTQDFARLPQLKPKGPFAGGLVGSQYHGWGDYQWDPIDLAAHYPEHLPWFREAELKHGRVAMLAFAGSVLPDFVRFPSEPFSDQSLDFVNAHSRLIGPGLGEGPMWWLLAVCGIFESLSFRRLGLGFEKLTLENAGDFGLKLGAPSSKDGMIQMQTKELKNGRLAMLAISGILTQSVTWNVHHFPFAPS